MFAQVPPAVAAARFLDSPLPLYAQLADLMRHRIARAVWLPNERLPSIEHLAREFKVARVTVRQAVDLLAREGLLSPQQGRGTFVTGSPPRDRMIAVVTSLAELARVYEDTQPIIVNIEESVTDAPLDMAEGLPAPSYAFMRRVHSRDGRPYCVINIYLDNRIFRQAPDAFRKQTVISLLQSGRFGKVHSAHQVLTIGAADVEAARLLGLPINGPVAEVRRVFKDRHGTVIYFADVTYRGDAIRLEMDLKP